MENQIIIPLNSDDQEQQLQAFVMALIHSYGLTAVLDAMFEGLLVHYDEIRLDHRVQRPVLDSINVASVVADQLLQKEEGQAND
ncbi:MAG: hypothetical protein AAGE59_23790 [Cyanobacteria bacterium P01_F01_bin.86]